MGLYVKAGKSDRILPAGRGDIWSDIKSDQILSLAKTGFYRD